VSRIWDALKEAQQEKARDARESPVAAAPKPGQNPSAADPAERRESSRRIHRVSLLVYGRDVDQQPFHEEAYTLEVNDAGCLVSLEASVAPGQHLFLTNTRNQAEEECRVITVGKRVRNRTRVSLKLNRPAPGFWREP